MLKGRYMFLLDCLYMNDKQYTYANYVYANKTTDKTGTKCKHQDPMFWLFSNNQY